MWKKSIVVSMVGEGDTGEPWIKIAGQVDNGDLAEVREWVLENMNISAEFGPFDIMNGTYMTSPHVFSEYFFYLNDKSTLALFKMAWMDECLKVGYDEIL